MNKMLHTALHVMLLLSLVSTSAVSMAQPVEINIIAIPEPYTVVELARSNSQSVEQLLRERLPSGNLVVIIARRGDAYLKEAASKPERQRVTTEAASIINQFAESSTVVDLCAAVTQKKRDLQQAYGAEAIIVETYLGRTSAQTCGPAAPTPVEELSITPITSEEAEEAKSLGNQNAESGGDSGAIPDPVKTFRFPWKTLLWILGLLGSVGIVVLWIVRRRRQADEHALQNALSADDFELLPGSEGIRLKDDESISDLVARLMLNSVVLFFLAAAPAFAQVDALIDVTHAAQHEESVRLSKTVLAPLLLSGQDVDLYAVGDSTRLLAPGITTLAELEAVLDSLPHTDQHTRLSEAFLQAARRAIERDRRGARHRTTVLITDFLNDDAENAALAFYPQLAAVRDDTLLAGSDDTSGDLQVADPSLRSYLNTHLGVLLLGLVAILVVLLFITWFIVRRVRRKALRSGRVTALRLRYADREETLTLSDLQVVPFSLEAQSFQPAYLHVTEKDGHAPNIVLSSNGRNADPKVSDASSSEHQELRIELVDLQTQKTKTTHL